MMQRTADIDPVDLGHNFVLADSGCNCKKRDRLPACEHLEKWVEQNTALGDQIAEALRERGIVAELVASNRVTKWAYEQTTAVGGITWIKGDQMVPLAAEWRNWLSKAVAQTIGWDRARARASRRS
jgi:hypothetical protein